MMNEEDEIQNANRTSSSSSSDGGGKEPLLTKTERGEAANGGELNGASVRGAVLNLSTSIIGAGIMALPSTMKLLGLVLGIVLIIAMAFLTDKSIEFLLRFSHIGNQRSFSGLVDDSYGGFGRYLLQFAIVLSNISVLIVYMIIIGDVLSGNFENGIHHVGVLEGWCGENWWNKRIYVLLITTLCVITPLTCFKNIYSLRFTSGLSVALAVLFLVITVVITIAKALNGSLMGPRFLPNVTDFSSFCKLFTVVPVLVNAYICHYNVHSIQNELEDPNQIQSAVRLALGMCSFVYLMTSVCGNLLFGESTRDDLLANFDKDLGITFGVVLNVAVRVSYVVYLMLVFPIIFHPLRGNIDDLIPYRAPPSNLRFFSITTGLIAVIFLGANFTPSIWNIFQFIGATVSVCIGFIFPAAVVLKDHYSRATYREKVIAGSMIVLAGFSIVIALLRALLRL